MTFSRQILAIFTVSLLAAGCTPRRDSASSEDRLEQGYRKIDAGDYDRAIAELEELRNHDSRPRVREALASAYAARGGLMIEKYWGFVATFQAPALARVEASVPFVRARKILSQMDESTRNDEGGNLARVARFMGTAAMWIESLERLPTLSEMGRRDVVRAIAVLDGMDSRGARLYRGLMGLVVFKTDLDRGFEGWSRLEKHLARFDWKQPNSLKNKLLLCEIDVKAFASWAGGILSRLNSTVEDVIVAYPSKTEGLKGALKQSWTVSRLMQNFGENSCL